MIKKIKAFFSKKKTTKLLKYKVDHIHNKNSGYNVMIHRVFKDYYNDVMVQTYVYIKEFSDYKIFVYADIEDYYKKVWQVSIKSGPIRDRATFTNGFINPIDLSFIDPEFIGDIMMFNIKNIKKQNEEVKQP